MAIEGFDYKAFSDNMAEQAVDLVPPNLQNFEKEYIVKTLRNFTLLAGEALYKDETLKLNAEQATFITQVIAEWSFHKSIDLIHSGILPQYWDSIMQKIAFTIFEVCKRAISENIPRDKVIQAVEVHVVKVYKQSIEELEQKGIIDENTKNRAESQSNIDAMAKQIQEEQIRAQQEAQVQAQANEAEIQRKREEKRALKKASAEAAESVSNQGNITNKQLKLMTLALILKLLSQDKVTTILNKFDSNDSLVVSNYMNMANLESKLDGDLIINCIKDVKDLLPIKRKLTKENVIADMRDIYNKYPREKIEKVLKNERPIVKRFVSQAYDGEYGELPLHVAGVVADYIKESM